MMDANLIKMFHKFNIDEAVILWLELYEIRTIHDFLRKVFHLQDTDPHLIANLIMESPPDKKEILLKYFMTAKEDDTRPELMKLIKMLEYIKQTGNNCVECFDKFKIDRRLLKHN